MDRLTFEIKYLADEGDNRVFNKRSVTIKFHLFKQQKQHKLLEDHIQQRHRSISIAFC